MKVLSPLQTRTGQIAIDGVICVVALVTAYLLRFEGKIPASAQDQLIAVVPALVMIRAAVHWTVGIYRVVWRYVGIREALLFARSVAVVSAVLLALRFLLPVHAWLWQVPISIIILEGMLTFLGMAGTRLLRRIVHERHGKPPAPQDQVIPTLLVGAGENALLIAKEARRHPSLGLKVVGYLDDDRGKLGMEIHGVRVLGTLDDLRRVAGQTGAKQVIITSNAFPAARILAISDVTRAQRIDLRIVPGFFEVIDRGAPAEALREVRIEDLLSRDPVPPSMSLEALIGVYGGKRILVTGAGGSIGSELCRQLSMMKPGKLFVLERDENGLFEIHRELKPRLGAACVPVLADITDTKHLERIFRELQPEVVVHAAAFKHVPVMEKFPAAAVRNNVFGTRTLAELADRHGCESFLLISTDKAVRPTSVMGASKRLAEMAVQVVAQHSKTRFSCVRFGNVLGSRGSVVPIFREQIRNGGPVTVTHPEATRYFMTIPEAANLVLQAATLGQRGEVFLLDMGRPVKIIDLARQMIQLSGTTEERVPIKIVGIRAGEKLYEELQTDEETMEPTALRKISRLEPQEVGAAAMAMTLERLKFLVNAEDHEGIRDVLRGLEIGYRAQPAASATGDHPVVS
ncbi:MAG TPA: nucleoside-diphosphate sugar epimerase/dehydratase [Kofleriaceae bacterium]|nr:nucleoside-diphosphate sugar epimerase/dehydratase [Kofleriaceae bacterium]